MKLWAMPCRATQDGRVIVESSDKMWPIGEGNGKPFQYSCPENPTSSMKRWKDMTLKDKLPMSVGAQYVFESHSCCWCEELTHWKRPWCWGRLRAGEGDERMRWLDGIPDQGHEYGDGQGGLACCGSCKESDKTERLKWTELMRMWRIGNPNTLLVGM